MRLAGTYVLLEHEEDLESLDGPVIYDGGPVFLNRIHLVGVEMGKMPLAFGYYPTSLYCVAFLCLDSVRNVMSAQL